MKSLLTLGFIAFIGMVSAVQHSTASSHGETEQADVAKPTLVMFHSDTCGTCKILGPKLKKTLMDIDPSNINVIRFDYTDRHTIAASKKLAAYTNLVDVQKQYGAKTGFAIIVDGDGKEVHRISATDDVDVIMQAINDHIA